MNLETMHKAQQILFAAIYYNLEKERKKERRKGRKRERQRERNRE